MFSPSPEESQNHEDQKQLTQGIPMQEQHQLRSWDSFKHSGSAKETQIALGLHQKMLNVHPFYWHELAQDFLQLWFLQFSSKLFSGQALVQWRVLQITKFDT